MAEGPEPFDLHVDDRDGEVVLRPCGELDLASAPEVESVVLHALRDGRRVVLDLRELEFLDSSGVRAIVRARTAAQEHGPPARFSVVRPDAESSVWRVIEVSGLDAVLDVVDG